MKYKVGDKVRILNTKDTSGNPDGIPMMNEMIGQVFPIEAVYQVQVSIKGWLWNEHNIELVEKTK